MPKTIFSGANRIVVDVLRQVRVEAALTQADLASRIGRDQSHISLIEGSQRRLDLVEFHEIVRAIGADPVRVFAEISARIDAEAGPTTQT